MKDSLRSLDALPLTGDLVLSTQLSGCTMVYKSLSAYFLAVRSGSNWTLFAQQNNPVTPGAGVSNFVQLHP